MKREETDPTEGQKWCKLISIKHHWPYNWQGNSTNDLGLRMVNALPFIHQLDRVVQTRFFACQHLVGSIKHAWKITVIYLTVTAFLVKHRSFNIMISNWFFVYNNCNIALTYLLHEYKNVFYVEDPVHWPCIFANLTYLLVDF